MTRREADAPAPDLPEDVARLAEEVEEAIRRWERDPAPWPDGRFESLALRAFRLQAEHVAPYGSFCRARGLDPEEIDDWREVPPVPTAAFRVAELSTAAPGASPLCFRTSGTTRGEDRRGAHPVPVPSLYRASLEAAFRRFVLDASGYPRGEAPGRPRLDPPVPILSLIPPYEESDRASLSWMCDVVRGRFGGAESAAVAGAEGVDWSAAEAWIRGAAEGGEPVVVLTTTLGLDAWTRRLERRERDFPLPPGSRLMDTGGSKGKEELDREEVLARAGSVLGLRRDHVVNELGMTELLSQRYEAPASGRLHGPPWLRTRALDPVTLEPLPDGATGILAHLDVANVATVSAVLTEDRGDVVGGAVRHGGRSRGAPLRGCSLSTAELLEARAADGDRGARTDPHVE